MTVIARLATMTETVDAQTVTETERIGTGGMIIAVIDATGIVRRGHVEGVMMTSASGTGATGVKGMKLVDVLPEETETMGAGERGTGRKMKQGGRRRLRVLSLCRKEKERLRGGISMRLAMSSTLLCRLSRQVSTLH